MASDGVHANALVPDQQVGKDIRQVKRCAVVMMRALYGDARTSASPFFRKVTPNCRMGCRMKPGKSL